nr:tripartite tricarboxylate transporter substrate binding protein [uncultured Roseococcus sp.]
MLLRRCLLLGSAALPLAAPAVRAQTRPIRLVVNFPPGGAVDLLGRVMAEKLGPELGAPIIVENRGGAGGLIGSDYLAKGDRDGTLVGLSSATILCAFPFLMSRMPFNPRTDLAPISQVTDGALMCVVNAGAARRNGWTDFRSLIAWSRAHPDQVKMGSSGAGTASHINIEAINAITRARILHVPYRGGGPAITDLVGGTIDMMFDVMPALMPHVQSGATLAFAVSSKERLPILPDVPAMGDFADLGLADHNVATWNSLMAPGGTPVEHLNRINAALRRIAAMPDYAEKLRPLGYTAVVSATPADMAALIDRDTPVWQRLVQISGATLD